MTAIQLSADGAAATIFPGRGGLVSRLRFTDTGGSPVEALWMPNDFTAAESGWPGGGIPLLFPFAGRVFHEGQACQYALDGTVRHMPIHGFAYGMPWTVVEASGTAATLRLVDTAATQQLYPFSFELIANIGLAANALAIDLTARNAGSNGKMPVALGLHPYLRLPSGRDLAGQRLTVHAATYIAVTNAGAAGKASAQAPAARDVPLTTPFTANAILGDHEKAEASLIDDSSRTSLTLHWEGAYQYLVLWRKDGEAFQCVEPWMGLPDAVSTGSGATWLAPGESVTARARLSFKRF